MANILLLSECHDGDKVYADEGELFTVRKATAYGPNYELELTNGIITKSVKNDEFYVYPVNPDTTEKATAVKRLMDKCLKNNIVNGSMWSNYLSDFLKYLVQDEDRCDVKSKLLIAEKKIDNCITLKKAYESFDPINN